MTRVRVIGRVTASRCRLLRESLDMAYLLRPEGPVLLDVRGMRDPSGCASTVVGAAAGKAGRAGRPVTVRGQHGG